MIGLDTNILVRYLVKDHPAQSRAAKEAIERLSPEKPGWISLVILAELIWSLKKTYKLGREDTARILEKLTASKDLVLQDIDTVRQAISLFKKSTAGFADCVLSVSARAAGCSKTLTFDRIAARDLGMELVETDTR